MDGATQLFFGLSFIVNLVVIGGLWWAARYETRAHPFWRSLAVGWTLSLVANLAWIAYDVLTGRSLPPLSAIDTLYLARYFLVGLAFWGYPEPLSWRQGLGLLGVMVGTAGLAWFGHYRSVWRSVEIALGNFLGVAAYPVLDAGVIYCGLVRLRVTRDDPTRGLKGMVVVSLVMYGVANWLNFNLRVGLLDPVSLWPTVFWMLCDVGIGTAVMTYGLRQREG